MKKILISLSLIVAVGAIVVGATGAFFSDTETSVGNTFTAGDIDLKIDNESYAIDYNIPGFNNPVGDFVASSHTSWELKDLTVEKFFDFIDLKPGDYGEDTISIHVGSNDAWVCAAAQITEDSDVTYTEPEIDDDPTVNEADPEGMDGELDSELNFAFWVDDGDNVLETCGDQTNGECFDETVFLEGTLEEMGQQGQIALADSQNSILGGNEPIPGDTTFYIAKAWCFGDLTLNPLDQDGETTEGPLDRGDAQNPATGVRCDGANVDNAAQTDRVVGDLQFYAEQSRNNGQFLCAVDWTPDFTPVQPAPQEEVGADILAYVIPDEQTECDVIVNVGGGASSTTIAGGLALAVQNETVCVADGTYNETVDIEIVGLSLLSLTGASSTATINGGVIIDAPGVTVSGFKVIPGNTEGTTAGFYLKEPADNATISFNEIDASGVADARGVVNVIGTDLSGVLIDNNHIHGPGATGTGIYTNPHTGMWTISNNDIDNFLAGIGQWNGANVLNNEFEHTIAGSEAIGVDNAWVANGGVVNFNNFLNDMKLNTYTPVFAGPINAENNFFSTSAATQVVETGTTVDTVPETLVQYPHQ